jgi:hypothetical protein
MHNRTLYHTHTHTHTHTLTHAYTHTPIQNTATFAHTRTHAMKTHTRACKHTFTHTPRMHTPIITYTRADAHTCHMLALSHKYTCFSAHTAICNLFQQINAHKLTQFGSQSVMCSRVHTPAYLRSFATYAMIAVHSFRDDVMLHYYLAAAKCLKG